MNWPGIRTRASLVAGENSSTETLTSLNSTTRSDLSDQTLLFLATCFIPTASRLSDTRLGKNKCKGPFPLGWPSLMGMTDKKMPRATGQKMKISKTGIMRIVF